MGLDLVEMVMAIEERFNVDIPDEDAEKLKTPRILYEYIIAKLKVDDPTIIHLGRQWTRDSVIVETRAILREYLGIQEFNDDDRFIEDLKVD